MGSGSPFDGQMVDLVDFLAVCMRKFSASLRTHIVDGTEIVASKEGARHSFKNLVAIFIHLKKFSLKSGKLHFEILGDASDICFLKIGS